MDKHTAHPHAALPAMALVRMPTVTRLTALSRSTIYRLVASGKFPAPVRLSAHSIAWHMADIEQWTAERPCAIGTRGMDLPRPAS